MALFHKQRKKSLTLHLALLLLFLLRFVTTCISWKAGNTSDSKACSHMISSPNSPGERRSSQALPRTHSCSNILRPEARPRLWKLQTCIALDNTADANASSSCWFSRENFERWSCLWTWWVCPRSMWRHEIVGPKLVIHKGPSHCWLPTSLRCLLRSLVPTHVYSLSNTREIQQLSEPKLGGNSISCHVVSHHKYHTLHPGWFNRNTSL